MISARSFIILTVLLFLCYVVAVVRSAPTCGYIYDGSVPLEDQSQQSDTTRLRAQWWGFDPSQKGKPSDSSSSSTGGSSKSSSTGGSSKSSSTGGSSSSTDGSTKTSSTGSKHKQMLREILAQSTGTTGSSSTGSGSTGSGSGSTGRRTTGSGSTGNRGGSTGSGSTGSGSTGSGSTGSGSTGSSCKSGNSVDYEVAIISDKKANKIITHSGFNASTKNRCRTNPGFSGSPDVAPFQHVTPGAMRTDGVILNLFQSNQLNLTNNHTYYIVLRVTQQCKTIYSNSNGILVGAGFQSSDDDDEFPPYKAGLIAMGIAIFCLLLLLLLLILVAKGKGEDKYTTTVHRNENVDKL